MVGTFVSKREIQTNTWEYTFSFTDLLEWKPGDYTYITLQKKHTDADTRGLRRHISIVRFNRDKKQFSIAVRLRDSSFKQELHALTKGDAIEFTAPYGELVFPQKRDLSVVFIVGGIGITAVLSVLEELEKLPQIKKVVLLYFNKSTQTIAYHAELIQYDNLIPNFSFVLSMTADDTWQGLKGRITESMLQENIVDVAGSYYYTVGPEGMNQVVEDLLFDMGVADDHIWREDFTGY